MTVVIIGGGLAGLATAAALAPRGLKVTVLESRNRLGGRAGSFTDAVSGQLVDACQHVSMGCCTNFAHFCRTTGIDHFLAPQPTLYFMTPDRRVSRFGADPLPAPLHLARSLLRAHYLSLTDKLRIAWGLSALRRVNPDDDSPLLPWLKRQRQNQRVIERFWSVVLVSALNESIERLGLKYAHKVFRDSFLRHRRGYEVYVPTVPLGRLYGEELQDWFAKHDARIETGAGVTGFDIMDNCVRALHLRDGRQITADWYVSALPFDRLLDLLPADLTAAHDCFADVRRLETAPITSVHFWFDRRVLDLPHVVLVDCFGQWLFDRGETAPGEHYVQVVVSAARALRGLGRDEILLRMTAELREILPMAATATILRAKVVTEHTATFSPTPGVDRWRPNQETPLPNLLLAGDWTATGWPATMESAVRSGYLAAESILRNLGRPQRLLQPDL
jgi:squalene-associated FAD-dependent desaturase